MFCRDLLQDFADHCNTLKAQIGRAVTPPFWGTHQSRSRSTYGLTKKVNDVFGATNKCVRCEAIRTGLSKMTRSRAHQREKPDCKYHGIPYSDKDKTILKYKPEPKGADVQREARKRTRRSPEQPADKTTEQRSASSTDAPSAPAPQRTRDSPQSYAPRLRTNEPTWTEAMSMPDRPLDRALLNDVVQWAGKQGGQKLEAGHTRFMDIGVGNNEGTLDDDTRAIHERIETCWIPEERFEINFAQVIMAPLGRRLASPHAEPRLCPWRKTILLTERDTVRVEEWMKIYGSGSVDNKEERYSRERMKWAIHLFAREKVVDINSPTDMPGVDEV